MMHQHLSDDQGSILITIVWVVLLLSLLAVGVLSVSLTARQTVSIMEEEEKDRLIAESALDVFLGRYFFDPVNQEYVSGVVTILDAEVRIDVEYDQGKIDLNSSDRDWLSALFGAAGRSDEDALSLADAILDWRDADENTRAYGAEAEDYGDAGLDYGPRNGPFESVGELKHVVGIDRALFECVAPLVTVYSKQGNVDLRYATGEVRHVAKWAYDRVDWGTREWEDPENVPRVPQYDATGDTLVGQSFLLVVALPRGERPKVYQARYRYKGTDIRYRRLTPLRSVNRAQKLLSCPWRS